MYTHRRQCLTRDLPVSARIDCGGGRYLACGGCERIIYQATHSHVIYSLIRPRNGCAPERTFSRRNGLRQTWDWEPWEARSPAVASIPSCRPFHHDDGAWAVHREQLAEMAHHLPIITLLPDMVKFMTGHTPTLLKSSYLEHHLQASWITLRASRG